MRPSTLVGALSLGVQLSMVLRPAMAAAPATMAVLEVAPSGSDAAPGPRGPFATVGRAIEVAREVRKSSPNGRIQILLRGGTYFLERPIVLTPEDSGASAAAPLEVVAQSGERPVISGGVPVVRWRRAAGSGAVWEGELATPTAPGREVRSLFVAAGRRQRARTPNEGYFRVQGASPSGKPMEFQYAGDDIRPEWAQAGGVEVVCLLAWADTHMVIESVDPGRHRVRMTGEPRPSNREENARYFIENAPDGLDAPGEWQWDRARGLVRYIPMPGEDPARAEAVVGGLDHLLEFQGDPAGHRRVHDVVIRGLTFSHTDWRLPAEGYADTQAAVEIRGDVRAQSADRCAVEDCRFVHLAGYGLELGQGCQHWRVVGNEFGDLGAGGIRLGVPSASADPLLQSHSHWITDNEIHDGGRVFHAGIGVLGFHTGTNHIAHNHIHHLNYTAVSLGWNWGYQETASRANGVEWNHFHHIGQGILSDMGAVYTLGPQPGTTIRNNLIHDVDAFTYGGWGLYPDEGTSGTVWENNIVYRCKSAGFHQHYGRENVVRNNILAFNREHQMMRTREEDHISFYFTNNVVVFDSGSLLGTNWKNDHFVVDGNVYWDLRQARNPEGIRFAGATLADWRARGHDVHSVFADPRLVAPAQDDFRLKSDSPAFRLGFHPVDLRGAGVRPPAKRETGWGP